MSIAELIMQGTNRSSESTAWVGDSLAKLGQQVGASLAQREQQKQAQEMLPMLQQNLQESMKLAGEGQSGAAYSKMFGALNQQTMSNPQLLPFIKLGFDAIGKSTDDFQRQSQIAAYNNRYAEKTGQETSTLEQATSLQNEFNQANQVDTNQVDVNQQPQTNFAQQTPRTIQELGKQARDAYSAKQSGMPAAQMPPQTEGIIEAPLPDAIDQQTLDKASIARGPVREATNDYVPSKKKLEDFIRGSDKFEKLDTFKRQDYMDNQSLVFPAEQNKQEYLNKLSKDKTIIPLNGELFAGVPGLVGVELPKEYQKWIVSSGNVGKAISFSIKPEAQNNNEAKGAVKWLNDWQNASSTVSSDSNLRDLLSKANGDILSLDLNQKQVEASDSQFTGGLIQPKKVIEYDASVKGNPDKTKLTEDQFKNLMMLKNLSVTANVNNAKFLRMETPDVVKPSVQQQAPKTSELPATQSPLAAEIPEEAMGLQKLVEQGQAAKAGESAKNVQNQIKDIDAQIKQLSSSTIAGSEGTMSPGRVSIGRVTRNKTPDEAQTDIENIQQLKNRKRVLEGKYSSPQEVGEAFKSGLLTREKAETILKNKFKM
jgi:hypothetical protein